MPCVMLWKICWLAPPSALNKGEKYMNKKNYVGFVNILTQAEKIKMEKSGVGNPISLFHLISVANSFSGSYPLN